MKIRDLFRDTLRRLGEQEGRWLFLETTGRTETQVLLDGDQDLPETEKEKLESAVRRREEGEPLQYILGTQDFMGLPIRCDRRALIPRLDTECVCEQALRIAGARKYTTALDLCCGTGAIGLALQKLGNLTVTLADISEDALALARENACALGIQAEILKGDLFCPLGGRTFDLIVCNPPYIPTKEIEGLDKEVRSYEPDLALDGGEDGLAFYRRLALTCGEHLNPGGTILCEIGFGQETDVEALFEKQGFSVGSGKDMQGVTRMVWAEKT